MLAVNPSKRRLQDGSEEWSRDPDLSKSIADRLNVYVEDLSDYEPDIKAQIQDFTWSLEDVSQESLSLQVDFKYPELYSQDGWEQYLIIKADFGDFEPGWDSEMILSRSKIPQQEIETTVSESAAQTIAAAGASAQAATAATMGVNVLLSGAMSQIWGMINGMQLLVNLPLFQVEFPEMSLMMTE